MDFMSTAIYLRKSRSDPDTEDINITLQRHEESLLRLASQKSLSITGMYKEVVSGDGLFVRPQMVRLLQDIEKNLYGSVLCMDIDRLGRSSQKDSGIIIETFQEHNVQIITPQKTYDLNDDMDLMATEMQTFIARIELKNITKRLQRGMIKTLEDGYHIGEPPYGYRRIYIDKHPTLEPVPEQADIIKNVFDMYVNQHIGSHIIAQTLNASGYRRRDGGLFSRNTIRLFLQNPVYIGKIVWNKKKHIKKKHPNDKHKTVLNPKSDWIIVDGVHTPIIDIDTFNKAQELRTSRTHPPSFTGKIMNPFAGVLICGKCGKKLLRQTNKKYGTRIHCETKGCNRSILLIDLEKDIQRIMQSLLNDLCSSAYVDSEPTASDRQAILQKNVSDAQKELSKLRLQESNTYDLLEQGIYDTLTFIRRNQSISIRTKALTDIIKTNTEMLKSFEFNAKELSVTVNLRYLLDNYNTLSPSDANRLIKKVVKKIIYYNDKNTEKNEYDLSIELIDFR